MKSAEDLRQFLRSVDRKGYPAYKGAKGVYQFPDFTLSIDHVQGDPFASPIQGQHPGGRERRPVFRQSPIVRVISGRRCRTCCS